MDSALIRQNSAHLVRSFTGGAAAMSQPADSQDSTAAERAPLITRQLTSTTRLASDAPDNVQQQMMEELTQTVMACWGWIVLVVGVFLALALTMAVLFICALMAVIFYHDRPCDQPLKFYLVVSILWSQVPAQITDCLGRNCSYLVRFWLSLAFTIPGWFLIGWGAYMVNSVETCSATNPGLFYPTRRYIYAQIVASAFGVCCSIFGAFGFRRVLLLAQSLVVKQPGCQAAVHKLPKVMPGSKELISAEDGEAYACPICMETCDGSSDEKAVVQTTCSHLFHEECLANWCENHLDCPLCRQQVGEPDKPTPAGDEQV